MTDFFMEPVSEAKEKERTRPKEPVPEIKKPEVKEQTEVARQVHDIFASFNDPTLRAKRRLEMTRKKKIENLKIELGL